LDTSALAGEKSIDITAVTALTNGRRAVTGVRASAQRGRADPQPQASASAIA
jgi:hypothetical protein